MVGMMATMTICIFPTVSVMMPLYVRNVLHFGPNQLGYLMAFSAAGSVLGAITLVSIPRPQRNTGMMLAALGVMFSVFALSRVHALLSLRAHSLWFRSAFRSFSAFRIPLCRNARRRRCAAVFPQ